MATGSVTNKDNKMDCDKSSHSSDENSESCDDSVADMDYQPSDDSQNLSNSDDEILSSESEDGVMPVLPGTPRRTIPVTPDKTPKSRWRQRRDSNYERVKSKKRRNLGQEYTSLKTKKRIQARELGPPCDCKKKCREKLTNTHESIFNKFWDLGSFDLQNSYIFGCIQVRKKNRSYKKKQKRQESSRTITADYKVNVEGQDVKICKVEFMSVHGLQNSRGRVNRIVKMKAQGSAVPETDKRGKHENRPRKVSDEQRQSVRNHIDLIPKYQSHYSRADNPDKTILNCDMTIAELYKKYIPWCEEQYIVPVKESLYRKIFCSEYNIGFKLPKSDTCKTCDQTNVQLQSAIQNNDDQLRDMLSTTLDLHKSRAKAMQDLLKLETERSKIGSNNKICVISFDLQQAMPIPKLTTGPAFYCRKIWLYNLGVHDCTAGQGYMYLWTEDKAKRGSDEVASVLLKFLTNKTDVEDLVIFTDNCPGQNKNWQMMALWLQMVKEKRFKSITHHFLISGHTHLPSDRDFALIEKRHRKYAPIIYSPEGWYEVIKMANRKTPFVVTIMEQDDFFTLQPLLTNIKKSGQTVGGENLDFSGVYSFQFRAENMTSFFVKHSVNGYYQEVNIAKKGRPVSTPLSGLNKKYDEPVKIAAKKIQNVKSLLPYIPPIHHPFFNSLSSTADAENESDNVEVFA